VIPVTDRLANLLKQHFDSLPYNPNDPILGGVKNCRRAFTAVLEAAGIEDVVFHSLRHTSITWMDLAGVSEMVKKNIVGHSTGDVHQIYHNSSENVLEDARMKMNAFRRKIDEQQLRKKMRVVEQSA
jgi:integrase